MSNQAAIDSWSINEVACSKWNTEGDFAKVRISNHAFDTIDFEVVRTPDGNIVPMNSSSDFRSEDWYVFTSERSAIDSNLMEVLAILERFQTNLSLAQEWVQPSKWFVRRGQSLDPSVWAGLAFLFQTRASMMEPKIIEMLGKDMKVDSILAKERVRKLRDKGFLEVVGRGNFAEGRMTDEAKKILIERGMMNA